jgi:hypothetical protein
MTSFDFDRLQQAIETDALERRRRFQATMVRDTAAHLLVLVRPKFTAALKGLPQPWTAPLEVTLEVRNSLIPSQLEHAAEALATACEWYRNELRRQADGAISVSVCMALRPLKLHERLRGYSFAASVSLRLAEAA